VATSVAMFVVEVAKLKRPTELSLHEAVA